MEDLVQRRSFDLNVNDLGLVSVIIPSYNRVLYIREAIESIYIQNYSPVEVIVVDDGSTDGSYELLCDLSGAFGFRLLTHPNRINRGQSAAINLGIRNATGQYISVLDSDDHFAPN